jgi:hypothetical protein
MLRLMWGQYLQLIYTVTNEIDTTTPIFFRQFRVLNSHKVPDIKKDLSEVLDKPVFIRLKTAPLSMIEFKT